ncbi:MAG: LamG-like jellyroll fold domain-containing protein [Verrucomicrobiota bacterium]
MLLGILLITTSAARAGRFALVAEGAGKRISQFYVSGQTWTYMTNFVDVNTPLGALAPLNSPTSVAQDQQGRIYISDQGAAGANRILRFNTNGAFMDMVGTNGLNGFNVPGSGIDDMVCGPDGNIYGTLAFGTANNQILKFTVATTNWSVLYSNSLTLSTPRGLDFGPDGNLYVNSRGNARMLAFNTNGVLLRTNATYSGSASTTPMGLRYAPSLSKFICTSGNGNSVIVSCPTNGTIATNGTLITAANPTGGPGANKSSLGAMADGTNIFYVAFINPGRVYLCNNLSTTSVTPVDSGTTPSLNSPTFMNFATGFGIGALQTVTLNVTRANMIQGTSQKAQLLGNYIAQSGIDISSDLGTAWNSSNPGVITVSANGTLTAVGSGSTILSATNSGKFASTSITVVPLVTTLIHRYGFTNDATDSIGSANGTPAGANYAFMNGQIALAPSGQYDYNYVDFGAGTATNDVLTFEAWASFGTNYNWGRLFDFGNNDGVNGTSFIMLAPHTSTGKTRLALRTPTGGETDLDVAGTLDNQSNVHIVAVIHPLAGYMKLYINGVLAAQNLSVSGQDLANVVNNFSYLGKSQFFVDPAANESVDEFRIYSGVLDATNVAINFAAGPNNFVSNPGTLTAVSLTINTNMLQQGSQSAVAFGNFANVAGVPLNFFQGVTFNSSDTNILTVSANGVVKAVGFGTASITVTYGAQSASYTVTSTPLPQAKYLVTDGAGNRVLQYSAIGTNWTLMSIFASGTYGGSPLVEPTGVAQDAAGNVYIADQTTNASYAARVLKFSAAGAYLGTLGTNGVDYFANTCGNLALDATGNVYMSVPFGTNIVLKYDVTTNGWSIFVPTTDGNYTLANPIGIALDPAGTLYVCNRGGFNAANRPIQKFDTNGLYLGDFVTGLVGPQALTWDAANNRFLVSVSATTIDAVDTNGIVSALSSAVAADALGIVTVEPNTFFSDYSASGVYALTSSSSAALVAGGITHAHQILQLALPPNLTISPSGNTFVVSWPYSTPAYTLKSSASINPPNWQSETNVPALVGNRMQVTLPRSSDTLFFRLSN